ncbi:hypothetical protein BGZ61DRAFT_517656 [Ilyonectria robusta]|uniref:uncharacterized protein n=1 Tax=Ilyonectria robusta TaxID=1079257 RepID=UPI001E8E9EFD|nr:uncharacterized protein BGZ61DRAFT_517656 [Ilyonectria robusta]KAH8699743.1 hypothetical protein BGZ61DRAFT_517656 [Ilyonectria robusta]
MLVVVLVVLMLAVLIITTSCYYTDIATGAGAGACARASWKLPPWLLLSCCLATAWLGFHMVTRLTAASYIGSIPDSTSPLLSSLPHHPSSRLLRTPSVPTNTSDYVLRPPYSVPYLPVRILLRRCHPSVAEPHKQVRVIVCRNHNPGTHLTDILMRALASSVIHPQKARFTMGPPSLFVIDHPSQINSADKPVIPVGRALTHAPTCKAATTHHHSQI